MKLRNRLKNMLALSLTMLFAAGMLQGCGFMQTQESMLASMKEFSLGNGTASVYLNQNWIEEDLGEDFMLCAANALGSQVFMMIQCSKTGLGSWASTLEEVQEFFRDSYGFSGEDAEAPEIATMNYVIAEQGQMYSEGIYVDAYVVYGETEYAYYVLLFGADSMNDSFMDSAKVSCSQFEESVPQVQDNTTAEVTDTIRWMNASYAVLTDVNGWDYNRFGGLPANEESEAIAKGLLEQWWDVTDRASADENLEWILTEGHRAVFMEDIWSLEEAGIGTVEAEEREAFLQTVFGLDEADAGFYSDMYEMYLECGDTAIDGWDYCRALNLMGYYYIAGYYTEQEALDTSLEIALTVQPTFDSWDELIESYMRGYVYWAEESADDRRAVYEDLQTRSDNPYEVDYHTVLEKTW